MNRKSYPNLKMAALAVGISVYPASLLSQTLALQPQANGNKMQQTDTNVRLRDALLQLKERYRVDILFEEKLLDGITVNTQMLDAKATVERNLDALLQATGLRYRKTKQDSYLIVADKAAKRAASGNDRNPAPAQPGSLPGSVASAAGQGVAGNAANAQDIRVTGKVTDENGTGLPGVSVSLKNTTVGTTTNAEGQYVLNVPDGSENGTLVFSFIGYTTEEVPLASQSTINIKLVPDIQALNEVVVVGYGSQKQVNVTGAVNTVNAETLESRPVVTVSQALQGAAPNLIIQQNSAEPGAPLNINIRGVGTLNNTSPLVVVDGIPASLDVLNPNDIESISVLKDAGSAAIYGSRSANGVILVTTKKGTQDKKPTVSYNGIYGWQSPTLLQRPVTGYEFAMLKNEALVNSGQNPQFTPDQIRQFNSLGDGYQWHMDAILRRNAPQQNHNLSVAGGTKTTTYLFSLGYLNQASIYQGPGYNFSRYNARLSLTNQITDRLKVGTILSYARSGTKETAYFTEWIIADASRIPRIYPVQDSLGRYVVPPSSGSNSLARLQEGGLRTNANDNIYGNVNAEYELAKGWKVRGVFGAELWNYRGHEFRKSIDYAPYSGGDGESSVRESFTRTLFTNLQLLTTYDKSFGRHNIQALGGYSTEGFTADGFQVRRVGIPGNDFGVINNGTTTDDQNTNGTGEAWAINSVFGRVAYNFNEKYLFEANVRYDGSSRFAAGNRWGVFPSFSAGWRITEEGFLSGVKNAVGDIKLRASWGQLGNQNIPLFQYLNRVSLSNVGYSFGNQPVPRANILIGYRDITWETSNMTNLGIDATVLGGKLTVSADYFNKLTNDILINLETPGTFGGSLPFQNAATVRNQGWEVAVSWRQRTGQVTHSLNANLADNLNTVVDTRGVRLGVTNGDRQAVIFEGFPIGSYYGYRSDGLYQNLEQIQNGPKPAFVANGAVQPGDIRYVDRNGDQVINEQDRFVLANPFPRYTYGLTYSAAWKGLDLTVFAQGVGRRSLYLRGEATEAFHNNWDNVYEQHLDRWTPTNPNGTYPRLTIGTASTNNNAGSDYWLQNAAYLRLKNLQLGYTLPNGLTRKIGLDRVRVYFTGQNILTFTRMRTGFDPEISEFNNSPGAGVAQNQLDGKVTSGRVYPNVQTWATGLDIRF